MLKIWLCTCYATHVGRWPGNKTLRTASFIIEKNGHIHQAAHIFPVANAWQHYLEPPDTIECQHPTHWCSLRHMQTIQCTSIKTGHLCTPLYSCACHKIHVKGLQLKEGEVSPGGVHASTEDWTSTERLLEGMGIFLSLYLAKAAWTASVCKSEGTHPHTV